MIKIFAALLFSLPIFGSDTVFEHKFIPTIILMEKDGVKLYRVLIQIDKDFPFAGMKDTLFPSISVSIRNNEDALIASLAPIVNSTDLIDGFASFEFVTSVGNAKNTELIFMKTGITAPETKRFKLNQFGAMAKVDGKTTHIEIE